jgi:hypothetical protein
MGDQRGLEEDSLEVLRIATGGTGEARLARDRPTLPEPRREASRTFLEISYSI